MLPDELKVNRHDTVLLLDEAVQRLQAGDFRSHDKRLRGNLHRIRFPAAEQPHAARFLQPLHFNFPDGIGNPLGRAWLGGLEKQLGCGLRKHRLGVLSVAFFKLTAALETQHNGIAVLAVFGDGGV